MEIVNKNTKREGKERQDEEKQGSQGKKQKFQIGDVVIYGTNGVCVIKDCGKLDMSCANQDTLYYTIEPYYNNNGSTFYTPIDNDKVILRPIITKDEAMKLMLAISLGMTKEETKDYVIGSVSKIANS